MKIKRLLAITVTALAAITLAACGKSSGSSDASSVKKITIFQSKVEITDDLKKLAKQYEKEKGVKVEVWGTTGDDYITQVKTKLSNRTSGPNIFSSGGGLEGEQLKSYMANMSDAAFAKNIAKNKAFEIDKKVLGLPYSVEGYGLIVNKALVDPKSINDPDKFIAFLKESKADGEFTGFELSQESYFLIGHMLNTAFSLQKNQRQFVQDVNSGKVKLQNVDEFKQLAKIYEAIRAYTNNPLQVNYDKQIGDFMTGKTASINQGMWINPLLSSYKNSTAELAMVPFPFEGNDKIAVDVPQYWHVNANKSSAEVKASMDFLNWLTSSKTGQDYIVNKFQMIPAMTNIKVDTAKMDTLSRTVYDASQSGDDFSWASVYWPFGIVDTDLVPVAQKFFTNKSMTGTEFVSQLSAEFVKAAQKK